MNILDKDLPVGFKDKLILLKKYTNQTYGTIISNYIDWEKLEKDVAKAQGHDWSSESI